SSERQFSDYGAGQKLELQRHAYGVFTEGRVPLWGSREHQTSASLALTVAGRYDHTDDFGGKATWQSGALWRLNAALSIAGSYGLSYKAPQLQELSGHVGQVPDLGFFKDPLRGNEPTSGIFIFGSNPNLKPETGSSRTVGLAYSSQVVHGLEATLTYYTVDIANFIAIPDRKSVV